MDHGKKTISHGPTSWSAVWTGPYWYTSKPTTMYWRFVDAVGIRGANKCDSVGLMAMERPSTTHPSLQASQSGIYHFGHGGRWGPPPGVTGGQRDPIGTFGGAKVSTSTSQSSLRFRLTYTRWKLHGSSMDGCPFPFKPHFSWPWEQPLHSFRH